MLPKLIDNPWLRLGLGVLVGFPFSVIALFAVPHGLVLGYGGVVEGSLLFMFAGVLTVLGVMAILGAWCRLFLRSTSMSFSAARGIRLCLGCGVISSLGLAVGVAYDGEITLSAILGLFAIVAVVLIKGTPVPNALSQETHPK